MGVAQRLPTGRLGFVPVPADPSPALQSYAHPERLVTADWLAGNLGTPGLVVVESDEDVLLYDIGHIPTAVKIDWVTDLNDSPVRDYITGEQFADLMNRKGISRDDTVVIYGDKSNWWAAYALWVFTLFGHEDVRLLDGGRDLWVSSGRETTLDVPSKTTTGYPVVKRNDAPIRAYKDDVLTNIGQVPLIDVRSPQEYTGERTHMPEYPEEGVLRGGHIPTAVSVPWSKAADDAGRFRKREELERLYDFLKPGDKPIAYCRIGERSSHTWFVLTHLLGLDDVRNYDGSWTEWGNTVRVPIVDGPEPGQVRGVPENPAS
ncbi:thiosulfate sulfurtransferase [Mycolicibacter heraklionensis]|nr:thiosulfate sulfurtransferase [Mycolicibacter heraklionensis]